MVAENSKDPRVPVDIDDERLTRWILRAGFWAKFVDMRLHTGEWILLVYSPHRKEHELLDSYTDSTRRECWEDMIWWTSDVTFTFPGGKQR